MIQLSHIIAQEIAFKVSSLIGYNINIFNRDGSIIGTTEQERLDKFHQGAYEAIKTGKEIVITENNNYKYKETKPGINMPLKINDEIIGAVGITGNPDMIKIHGKLTRVTIETMLKASLMEKQTNLESRALENFLYDLLYDRLEETQQSLEYRASLLGINLNTPRVALVINLNHIDDFHKYKEKITHCIQYVLKGNNQYLLAYTGGNNFTVFLPISTTSDASDMKRTITRISKNIVKSIFSNLGFETVIGVGSLNNKSFFSLKENFQEACQALASGKKFKKENKIHFIDELGLALLLNNIPESIADNFAKYMVGYKEKAFNTILDSTHLYTLKVFFDCNLNISETSRALFIHRNTLLYRLDKIYKLTNRDPRVFSEAMELKVLLLLNNSLLNEEECMFNMAVQ